MRENIFKVGDYAYFTRTPKQLEQPGVVNKVTAYKIIQIQTVKKSVYYNRNQQYNVYNTKHGAFTEFDIGSTVFYTEEQAKEKLEAK